MLGKILFFVLLILLALVLWKKRQAEVVANQKKSVKNEHATKMIQCPVCGIHFAEAEGHWYNGHMYCSLECQKKAKSACQ